MKTLDDMTNDEITDLIDKIWEGSEDVTEDALLLDDLFPKSSNGGIILVGEYRNRTSKIETQDR